MEDSPLINKINSTLTTQKTKTTKASDFIEDDKISTSIS